MEFCGRCGTRLGRGPERGRFCRACGHETPGNARYPLYADGSAAVTRPRPASVSQAPVSRPSVSQPSVSQSPTGTAVVQRVRADAAPVAAGRAPAGTPADVTRRRLRSVDPGMEWLFADAAAQQAPAGRAARSTRAERGARPETSWRVAVATALATMVIVVLLGLFLLTR